MNLNRTRVAYTFIRDHVANEKPDSFIESCLAQYLAVIFYAEVEEKISEIITLHLKRFTASRLGHFLSANMDNIISRTPKSDIAKILGLMDEGFKSQFNQAVAQNDVSFYSNIIRARHNVGHKQGATVNLNEIMQGIDAADKILVAIDKCFVD